jgi:hypothetical protein
MFLLLMLQVLQPGLWLLLALQGLTCSGTCCSCCAHCRLKVEPPWQLRHGGNLSSLAGSARMAPTLRISAQSDAK